MFPKFAYPALGKCVLPRQHARLFGKLIPLFAALTLAGACTASDDGSSSSEPPPSTEQPAGDSPDTQPASATARIKRKQPRLLQNDLLQALTLPQEGLCRELGQRDCMEVHNILLGGVEPYRLRIDEPIRIPSLAAPTAVDRIVLSACGERASRDFAGPDTAEIFGAVAEEAAADATAVSTAARESSIQSLYRRLLARSAAAGEIDALTGFYEQVAAEVGDETIAQTWAQLVCYSIATTTEFLFY